MKRIAAGFTLSCLLSLLVGPVYAERSVELVIVPVKLTVRSVNESDQTSRTFDMMVGQDGKITITQDGKTIRPGQILGNGDYVHDDEVMATLTPSGKIVSYGEAVPITISRDAILRREGVPFIQVSQGRVIDVSPKKNAMISEVKVNGKVTRTHHTMTLKAEPQASRLVAYLLAISMMLGK